MLIIDSKGMRLHPELSPGGKTMKKAAITGKNTSNEDMAKLQQDSDFIYKKLTEARDWHAEHPLEESDLTYWEQKHADILQKIRDNKHITTKQSVDRLIDLWYTGDS